MGGAAASGPMAAGGAARRRAATAPSTNTAPRRCSRLEEEQREFRDFLDRLRFAKDKTEFDQFMAERRNRPARIAAAAAELNAISQRFAPKRPSALPEAGGRCVSGVRRQGPCER